MKKKFLMITVLMGLMMIGWTPMNAVFAKSETIRVQVLGLVCDFCAQSLELIFMEEGSTEKVKVSLSDTRVDIVTKDGKTLSDEVITDLIERAGYNVESIARE